MKIIFLNIVKGHKIKCSHWTKEQWFIPLQIVNDDQLMKGIDFTGYEAYYKVNNGFNWYRWNSGKKPKWEIFYE